MRAREARWEQEREMRRKVRERLVAAVHTLSDTWHVAFHDDGVVVVSTPGLSPVYINTWDFVSTEKPIGFR